MKPHFLHRLPFLLAVPLSLATPRTQADEHTDSLISLRPHAYLTSGAGATTADDPADILSGGHDPNREGAYLQGFELGLSLFAGDHLEGFANYNFFSDPEGSFDGEWEEAFLKVIHLPGGAELRGGRFLNRFGFRNNLHLHDWNTIDQHLAVDRFLGEDGLGSIGGEISLELPLPGKPILSFAAGEVIAHDHSHGDDHGHGDGHGDEEEHGHFESDLAGFDSTLFSADLRLGHVFDDRHRLTHSLSGAWGKNGFDEFTQLYGAGFQYAHRPEGLEFPSTRIQAETLYRHFEARDEDGDAADFGEVAVYATIAHSVTDRVELYLRGEFASGVEEAELEERWRVSPGATFYLNSRRSSHFRIQYNHDHGAERGTDHSIWAQVEIALDPGNADHDHAHHHSH